MNKSKIIRNRRQNGFTIVSNVARLDKSISFRALGLLTYLMGLPEDWSITIESLSTVKTDGRTSVTAGLNELMNAGFLKRTRRYENGRFVCYDYIVFDEKDFSTTQQDTAANIDDYQQTTDYRNTEVGKPVYGNTESGKPDFSISDFRKSDHLYNKEDNNKDYNNNHIVDLKVDGASVEPSENKQKVSATTSEHKQKKDQDAARAIEYLNEVTGRSFRTSEASLKHVRARLREGFTFDDICAVVVFKNAQWAHKPDMKAYLRPETLFGTKFDGYLQEAKAAKAARVTVVEGATDKYSAYAQWAQAKYSNLGAEGLLNALEHENITSAEGKAHFMRTLSTRELNAVFENAHIEANRLRGVGQQARVADVFKRLINEAQKPK